MKIEKAEIKQKILESYKKCIEKGILPSLTYPLVSLPKEELEKKLKENETLITVFRECTKEVVKNLSQYIFLLTDTDGYLLETIYNKRKYKTLSQWGIRIGISLREESCGINAVSLSLDLKKKVYIKSNEHFCEIFKNWDCIAIPLKINNKIIGCLDISSINNNIPMEIEVLLDLLAYKIISEYQKKKNIKTQENLMENLTEKQIAILRLSAEGNKELAIASELGIKISTVKYHKKEIVKKMRVHNFQQAIAKAIKYGLI